MIEPSRDPSRLGQWIPLPMSAVNVAVGVVYFAFSGGFDALAPAVITLVVVGLLTFGGFRWAGRHYERKATRLGRQANGRRHVVAVIVAAGLAIVFVVADQLTFGYNLEGAISGLYLFTAVIGPYVYVLVRVVSKL